MNISELKAPRRPNTTEDKVAQKLSMSGDKTRLQVLNGHRALSIHHFAMTIRLTMKKTNY